MKIFYLFLLINLSIFAQDHEHHAGCQHRHYPEELNDSDLEVIPFVDTLFASCQERQNLKSKNDISLQTLLFVDNLFESHGDRIGEALGEIEGFGHAHEDDHGHSGPEDGFQWRHAEIEFAASYKNLITLGSVFGFSEGEKEVEELFLQTDALPFGFGLKLGRFRSGIGRFTQRHQHALDFTSQNLTQLTFFGDHGIQENGIQLIWNTPSIEGLLLGVELFEGDTEGFSEGISAQGLKKHNNPKLWTSFLKYQHDIDKEHYFTYGLTYAQGRQQEAHDEDEDEVNDHFFDGKSYLYGADFAYFYDNGREDGQGDISFEIEYFRRDKELTVARHDLEADAIGLTQSNRQDGITIQGLYTFIPKFRAGARFEAVGFTNEVQEEAGDTIEKAPASYRSSLMADTILGKYNLLRFQVSHYDITTHEGDQDFWTFTAQWQLTFGAQKGFNF